MIVRGRHYQFGDVLDFDCEDGWIRSITPAAEGTPALGGGDVWIVPGLIDLQVNGFAGSDFCSETITPAEVECVSTALAQAGVTAYLPTVITNSAGAIEASMRAIAAACEQGGAARERILGIHLEGPYISPVDGPRGTHPLEHVRPANWQEFCRWQDAAGGRIRLVTLAPEIPGALRFISQAREAGVVVSLGHHTATREQIDAAVTAGASLCTHLGNGSHAQLPRHPNYIWEQLANDALHASIIVDGHHLPPSVVKAFYRAKGADRLILVSDVVWLAGMPAGRYQFAGQEVDLSGDGSVRLAGTAYLAGSVLHLVEAVGNIMTFAGAPLAEAVRMSATNPADLVGALDRGRLQVGCRADLLVLRGRSDGGVALVATIAGGKVVYQHEQ
ncbi:MAG TPA: N-acetylglucosamine-6-phosphate deacetylase [Anaerolineae bacterium]